MNAVTVTNMLGGPSVLKQTPRSALDWVTLIRGGIPAAAVDSLTKMLGLTQAEFGAVLGIPERTLARRKKEGMLNAEESAKLVRLARVVRRALEVFGDLETAADLPRHWRNDEYVGKLRTRGTQWATESRTAILAVPSAVIPAETNYLLNPLHPDFKRIQIGKPMPLVTDLRLLKRRKSFK